MMPTIDIDRHLSSLRRMQQSTDPAVQAAASERGKAVAPDHCAAAHAIADMIDTYRTNGYSAGEAIFAIYSMIEPIMEVPIIDTNA